MCLWSSDCSISKSMCIAFIFCINSKGRYYFKLFASMFTVLPITTKIFLCHKVKTSKPNSNLCWNLYLRTTNVYPKMRHQTSKKFAFAFPQKYSVVPQTFVCSYWVLWTSFCVAWREATSLFLVQNELSSSGASHLLPYLWFEGFVSRQSWEINSILHTTTSSVCLLRLQVCHLW